MEITEPKTTSGWVSVRRLQFLAVGLAAAAGAIVLFAPLYSDVTELVTSNGVVLIHERTRLSDDLGRGVFPVVGIPLLVTIMPLFATARAQAAMAWFAGILLLSLCVLALLSIGLFYLPATAALIASAVLAGRTR